MNNNFNRGTDVHELTAAEMDSVTGGNAFWGAVFGFAMDNLLGAYVKNSGKGYGDIIKEVADAAGKQKPK